MVFLLCISEMPAIMDDPASATIFRVSGQSPFPDPANPGIPEDITPRQVTLRDRQTTATVVPFAARHQVPPSLALFLCELLNREIEGGDTYPMMDAFEPDAFAAYWFQNFAAVMLLGDIDGPADVREGRDWAADCLGSFYIKPNYPGRSSHVCNAGFLVTPGRRNRGVGRLMGEAYIDWAPRLGYTYSVFNLVYETNVASCKIWDALGFKRIGRVKGCGNLRSYPDRLIDAIIYGRDLAPGGADSEELVSEERFDKIKFYLKYGKYPNGSDRAEKSRLRSAATHYKLLDGDKLMLKDKEVIADPARQYDIARAVHVLHHGGINKTTATIAEKHHWSRIKETVSDVIRNCAECKELGKTPNPGGAVRKTPAAAAAAVEANGTPSVASVVAESDIDGPDGRVFDLQDHDIMSTLPQEDEDGHHHHHHQGPPSRYANPSDITVLTPSHAFHGPGSDHGLHVNHHNSVHEPRNNPMLQDPPRHHQQQQQAQQHGSGAHAAPSPVYQPIDPQIISQPPEQAHDNPFEHYHAHDAADFQALLSATTEEEQQAVDHDLEMLIEQQQDDDDDDDVERGVGGGGVDGGRHGGADGRGNGRDVGMYDVEFGEPDG